MNEEKLKLIEESAAAFLSPQEIAVIIDYPIDQFIKLLNQSDSDVAKAYTKGKINKKKQLRERVIKMAEYGSNSAEQLVENYIAEQKISERDAGTKIP